MAGSPCVEWATKGLQSHLTPARKTDKYFLNIRIHLNIESRVNNHIFVSKVSLIEKTEKLQTYDQLLCICFALPVGNTFLHCVSDPGHVEIFQRKSLKAFLMRPENLDRPVPCWSN